jgi:hypothetical protein
MGHSRVVEVIGPHSARKEEQVLAGAVHPLDSNNLQRARLAGSVKWP